MAKHLQSGLHGGPHDLVHAQRLRPLPFAAPVRSRDDVDLRIEFESELRDQVGGRRVSGRDHHELRVSHVRRFENRVAAAVSVHHDASLFAVALDDLRVEFDRRRRHGVLLQSLLNERPHPAKTAHDGVIDHVRYAFILNGSIRSIASQKSESTSECVERKRNTGHDSRRQCHGDRGGNHGQREDVLPEYAEIGRPLSDDEAELSDLDHPQTGHDRGWRKISG